MVCRRSRIEHDARRDPELAVLSAIAHGKAPVEVSLPVARAALSAITSADPERAALYSDLVMAGLGEAARTALEDLMRTQKYEYQTEFARHHQAVGKAEGLAEGKAEGLAEGKAQDLLLVLQARGLETSAAQRERIMATRDLEQLERWIRRAVTAVRVEEVLE